jgi:hypothetical protein
MEFQAYLSIEIDFLQLSIGMFSKVLAQSAMAPSPGNVTNHFRISPNT